MFRGLLSGEILLKSNFPVGEVTLKTSSFSKSHSDKLSVLDIDDCDEKRDTTNLDDVKEVQLLWKK
jgi:hypothetical protein